MKLFGKSRYSDNLLFIALLILLYIIGWLFFNNA